MSRRQRGALVGTIAVPGDKSISHRALILSALASGRSSIDGLNLGADVLATVGCLRTLGAAVELDEDNHTVEVKGWEDPLEPLAVLDAGNSGTTLRSLAGICARVSGMSVLTGDDTLRRRPMDRIVEPLRAMGATIDGRAAGRFAPLCIRGGELRGVSHRSPVASAQIKTCLLLAGLGAEGRTSVTEPRLSRDHTERMLRAAGVPIEVDGTTVSVEGGGGLQALHWQVPGDVSSAFFFLAAAAIVPGSDLTVADVGLNPTRIGALEVLREMGAEISWETQIDTEPEPRGNVRVAHSGLKATSIGPDIVPRLIDEIPALAVVASQADGTTVFEGVQELRVKESDRIATVEAGLRALGVEVSSDASTLRVTGPARLGGGAIDSHLDHRIAMSFAIAALVASGDVRITGWSSVETSFPGFLDLLKSARGKR